MPDQALLYHLRLCCLDLRSPVSPRCLFRLPLMLALTALALPPLGAAAHPSGLIVLTANNHVLPSGASYAYITNYVTKMATATSEIPYAVPFRGRSMLLPFEPGQAYDCCRSDARPRNSKDRL